jgi:hypothetical protein
VTHTDVHPEFPSLRIPSAVIYKFFKVISDKLIDMGPASGKFATLWECTILDSGGRACCNRRRINNDKNKSCQNCNLIAHLRERSATCKAHKAAMKQVEIGSKNCVEVDGDMVKIHNFSEDFLHHVDLLWLRVRGLSKSMISSDEFREFVRGYDLALASLTRRQSITLLRPFRLCRPTSVSSVSATSTRNSRDLRVWVCSLTCGLTPLRTQPMAV